MIIIIHFYPRFIEEFIFVPSRRRKTYPLSVLDIVDVLLELCTHGYPFCVSMRSGQLYELSLFLRTDCAFLGLFNFLQNIVPVVKERKLKLMSIKVNKIRVEKVFVSDVGND